MNIRITALALLASCLAGPAAAQDEPEAWVIASAVAHWPAVNAFNAKFIQAGLPAANVRHLGWGLDVRWLSGSLLFGGLYERTMDATENDSLLLSSTETGLFGEVGIKLAPFKFLTIVPLLGVGGLSQSYSMGRNTAYVEFDTLLGGNHWSTTLSSGTKLAGMGALEIGLLAQTSAGQVGLTLRGGYLYSPFAPSWRAPNGAAVTDAPDMRLGGPVATVGFVWLPAAQTVGSGP